MAAIVECSVCGYEARPHEAIRRFSWHELGERLSSNLLGLVFFLLMSPLYVAGGLVLLGMALTLAGVILVCMIAAAPIFVVTAPFAMLARLREGTRGRRAGTGRAAF